MVDIYGWDWDESALHAYVDAVAHGLGVRSEYTSCAISDSASAYLALEERLPNFPDRDLALIWDERHGWAAAIESSCGEDLIVLAFLGREPVPSPAAVAEFVNDLLAGGNPGQHEPPVFGHRHDLAGQLRVAANADRELLFRQVARPRARSISVR